MCVLACSCKLVPEKRMQLLCSRSQSLCVCLCLCVCVCLCGGGVRVGLGVYGRGCVVGCVYVCEGVDCWVCLTVFVRGGQGGCAVEKQCKKRRVREGVREAVRGGEGVSRWLREPID